MVLSFSKLQKYLDCPRSFFYGYIAERIKKLTDYPRLCGIVVHRTIQHMHDPPKKPHPHPFLFETRKKAIGYWFSAWERYLDEVVESGMLEVRKAHLDQRFRRIGLICVSRYWSGTANLESPLEIEKTYSFTITPGIRLIGRLDQLRRVSLDYVKRHRPDLIVDGKLKPGYDPVVIVDLKSGDSDYAFSRMRFKIEPTLTERVRRQYALHENLQATGFSYLYHMTTGKKPIGFVFYHLRSGQAFFTFREERDYPTLLGVIEHLLANLELESFPKNVGRRCETCDYVLPCREDRDFTIVPAEAPPGNAAGSDAALSLPAPVLKSPINQRRLHFPKPKEPRKVGAKPPKTPKEPKHIILLNLPWDEKPSQEEIRRHSDLPAPHIS